MGMTFTLHEDLKYPFGVGSHNEQICYLVPDNSYPTGGYVYASSTVNGLTLGLDLKVIMAIIPIGGDTSAIGFDLYQNFETGKVMILQNGGFTPAGTNASSSVTGNVTVVGGGIGEATGINPDSNAGVLSKAAATNRTIPIATYLGAAPTAGAQTFTGTAVAAGPAIQVPNATDLSALRFLVRIVGR